MADDPGMKIQVDSDWKAQARAEKEKLAGKSATGEATAKPAATAGASPGGASASPGSASSAAGRGQLPPANFETLVSTMATQALFAMGAIPDPRTGQRMASLDLARHHIDMLGVIEEKTKGNLSQEESSLISTTLYELRQRYIQLVTALREQGR